MALWPFLGLAEQARLVRVYGYPKDNALPPPLPSRLLDSRFVFDLREALDEAQDVPLSRSDLLRSLETLTHAAQRHTERQP